MNDTKTLAERLQESPERGMQAKDDFVARLAAELDGLLALVVAKSDAFRRTKRVDAASPEFHALAVLSFARYREAADLCADLVDVRSTDFSYASDEDSEHFSYFPFAIAAAAIGAPAAVAVLSETARTADPKSTRFQLSCLVLKKILGEHLVPASIDEIDGDRLSQVQHLLQSPLNRWRASKCSDFMLR